MTNPVRQHYEDRVQENIKWYEQKREQSLLIPMEDLSAAFPQGTWEIGGTTCAEFKLPFDFHLIEIVRQYMAENHPEFKFERENQYVWDYAHSGPEAGRFLEYCRCDHAGYALFDIAFRTGVEGTTCVIQELGAEQKKVYEVVCVAGAQEGFGGQES